MKWDQFDAVVEKYRLYLQDVSRSFEVAKDPRFCWTLGVWAAAGVEIDYVTVSVRSLDAMVRSRAEAGWLRLKSAEEARIWTVYGLGLCMTAIVDHRLDHSIIRFPDYLENPDELYSALRFPRPTTKETFMRAFDRVTNPDLVHDER